MSGSLDIPYDIGSQSGPRVQASLFDDNWEAIASYVNAREVAFDLFANRPAAGVTGRWYFATDQSTLYADTGDAWITAAGAGAGGGSSPLPGSIKQDSIYTAADPNLFTLAADRVVVVSTGGVTAHSLSAVSVSVNLTVVGNGGRDQAGAFSGNSWVYLYWVYNPTTATVTGLISAAPWPATGPTLPSGYTEFAYAGAARLNASAQFEAQSIRGRRTLWHTPQAALTAGTASAATAISLANVVPPNAPWVSGYATMKSTTAPAGAETVYGELSLDNGVTQQPITKLAYVIGATQAGAAGGSWETHPRSQQIYYRIVDDGGAAADGTNQLTVLVNAFENPNGG